MGRRGGWRPRNFVIPDEVPMWTSGLWGARRVRDYECAAVLRAELVYHQLICEGTELRPGWRAMLGWPVDGQTWSVEAETVANAVWRRGRLFLRCPACRQRATRLYVPTLGLRPRCRRCWGISYESQSRSYKATGFLAALGIALAYETTDERRRQRRRAARERYAERRSLSG